MAIYIEAWRVNLIAVRLPSATARLSFYTQPSAAMMRVGSAATSVASEKSSAAL